MWRYLSRVGAIVGVAAPPADPAQPPRVGYVMGALITRAYYDNADDKVQAIQDILSVTDYPAFLERSRYAPQ